MPTELTKMLKVPATKMLLQCYLILLLAYIQKYRTYLKKQFKHLKFKIHAHRGEVKMFGNFCSCELMSHHCGFLQHTVFEVFPIHCHTFLTAPVPMPEKFVHAFLFNL